MKNLIFIFFSLPLFIISQNITPSVIASSGNTYSNANLIIDFTLGETVIETYHPSITPLPLNYHILTQGFNQGVLKITTSVEFLDIDVKVYPNPTSRYINIEFYESIVAELLVYDISGKLIIKDKLNNSNKMQLDFSLLHQGNYILKINTDNKSAVYQINKSR